MLAEDLQGRCELDIAECFIDGVIVAAKKGPARHVRGQTGQGYKAHGSGRPVWSSSRRPHGVC
jgi:hypothetical protein